MTSSLPELRAVPLSQISDLDPPTLRIQSDEDVVAWTQTTSFHDYRVFLRRLNESVVGHFLPYDTSNASQATLKTINLLDTLDNWIDEIPPQDTPQRFGNLSFRLWGSRLEEHAEELLQDLFPEASGYISAIPLIKPYFLTSFGSFLRMDYGTGHETSFTLFLLCLTLMRYFQPEPDEERQLVFGVFLRYLRLCWKLQDVYRLEPAGSHGVWGLDDSSFLGYIFGSGQLRDQRTIPVSAILNPPLPSSNLYFMSVMRIHEVKTGPFHEHSSQLYSIATSVPNWGKVNSGLFKMYEAEVLGKRVVVQHVPLGGLLPWDPEHRNRQPDTTGPFSSTPGFTAQAPWATKTSTASGSTTRMSTEPRIQSSYPGDLGTIPSQFSDRLMGPPSSVPTRK